MKESNVGSIVLKKRKKIYYVVGYVKPNLGLLMNKQQQSDSMKPLDTFKVVVVDGTVWKNQSILLDSSNFSSFVVLKDSQHSVRLTET
jgi:hypothetical protein